MENPLSWRCSSAGSAPGFGNCRREETWCGWGSSHQIGSRRATGVRFPTRSLPFSVGAGSGSTGDGRFMDGGSRWMHFPSGFCFLLLSPKQECCSLSMRMGAGLVLVLLYIFLLFSDACVFVFVFSVHESTFPSRRPGIAIGLGVCHARGRRRFTKGLSLH